MLHNSSSWEYYLNIVGSEYPLTTNYQLIKKMESVDNDKGFVEVSFATEGVKNRMKYAYLLPESEPGTGKIQVLRSLSTKITLYTLFYTGTSFWGGYYKYVPYRTAELNPPPPLNLTIMYGIKNVVIKRRFADFVINSEVGKVCKKGKTISGFEQFI